MPPAPTLAGPVRPCGEVHLDRPSVSTLRVRLTGTWRLDERLPSAEGIEQAVAQSPEVRRIVLDARGVPDWDTTLVSFVLRLLRFGERRGLTVDRDGLPRGLNRLIALATAVPEKLLARPDQQTAWLARVGLAALAVGEGGLAFLRFLGDAGLAFVRFARGRANFRWIDLAGIIQACGPGALPIVSLISFLVGLILAFMGAVQLRSFGAQV